MIIKALLDGLIWSVLWMIYVYMLLKLFPWEMVHEYPENIKKACTMAAPTSKQLKKGKLVLVCSATFLWVQRLSKHRFQLSSAFRLPLDCILCLEPAGSSDR